MNSPAPVFSRFADASGGSKPGAKVDHRSRASMIAFLVAHDTHREDYDAPVFANCVKFNWGALLHAARPYMDAVRALLAEGDPFVYDVIHDTVLAPFHDAHPDAEIWQEGRSGGWLTLHISPDPFKYVGAIDHVDTYSAEDWSFAELRAIVRLVEAFDVACDQAVAAFMDYAINQYQPATESEMT